METVLFFRVIRGALCFYPVQLQDEASLPKGVDRAADIATHVRLNPGTVKVETVDGKLLWPMVMQ